MDAVFGLSPEDLALYSDWAGKLTVTVLLGLGVWALMKGWLVPGYIYKAKVAENEKLVGLLQAGTDLAEKQTDQADRVLEVAERMVSK